MPKPWLKQFYFAHKAYQSVPSSAEVRPADCRERVWHCAFCARSMAPLAPSSQLISVDLQQDTQGSPLASR
eukprot:s8571_g3.t1